MGRAAGAAHHSGLQVGLADLGALDALADLLPGPDTLAHHLGEVVDGDVLQLEIVPRIPWMDLLHEPRLYLVEQFAEEELKSQREQEMAKNEPFYPIFDPIDEIWKQESLISENVL